MSDQADNLDNRVQRIIQYLAAQTIEGLKNPFQHSKTVPNGKCPQLPQVECVKCLKENDGCLGADCAPDCPACVWDKAVALARAIIVAKDQRIKELEQEKNDA